MKNILINIKKIYSEKLIIILFSLNILDLILTYTGLKTGYIDEKNPMLRDIYLQSNLAFILVKIIITFLACYAIGYGLIKFKWVRKAVYVPLVVYVSVFLIHMYILSLLI